MQCITLLLNDSEWRRISEVARLFWPNKVLDGQLSRNEATRRLLLTFGLDAMEGAELASTAQEDGVENLFGRNAGKAATIRQGRCPSREVEHFIQINLQLVPDQAWRCLRFLPPLPCVAYVGADDAD